ncbi:hypothetical protein [Shewanella marina]|uniref:hypothetical protein n=1 Tax=Shewanella marina TaxID=487319 RepID=UPI0011DD0508|nr:hypothetical protein [Shewanella marina]
MDFKEMTTDTRFFFLSNFPHPELCGKLDRDKAAQYFDVTTRTIYNWWRYGCPQWVNKHCDLARRAIPKNKTWRGFYFGSDNKLHTPYDNLQLEAHEVLSVFQIRQFHQLAEQENKQLRQRLGKLRDNDELQAIREELDMISSTITKLKDSPILAHSTGFSKSVSRQSQYETAPDNNHQLTNNSPNKSVK